MAEKNNAVKGKRGKRLMQILNMDWYKMLIYHYVSKKSKF